MAELTTAYLDKKLEGLATKDDLKIIRADLAKQTEELKAHAVGLQEELAIVTKKGFEDVYKRFDVRSKVETLERQVHEIRQELNLA